MVLSHQVFVTRYTLFHIHPYLVNEIKTYTELFLVFLILIMGNPVANQTNLREYHYIISI